MLKFWKISDAIICKKYIFQSIYLLLMYLQVTEVTP